MRRTALFPLCFFLLLTSCAVTEKNVANISELEPEPTIRVKIGGRRGGIRTLPMETYLAGVIGNEMSRRWPVEALKAQAVAARSYALYRMRENHHKRRRWDVLATQGDQVFRARDIQNQYLLGIVESTRGEVLWKNGHVVEAFYSSTCGGTTRSAAEAGLSRDSPLKSIGYDNYCRISPHRNWVVPMTLADMEKKLRRAGIRVTNLRAVRVAKKEKSGYVDTVAIVDDKRTRLMSSRQFRKIMGVMRVKSTCFDIQESERGVAVHGSGFGHGVGMCQYGAKQMSVKGRSYKSILAKYYPNVSIRKIY
ncbi:MAG: SpoIID/LytB domain-containing protein [Deltaproteobacteria bacterium]|nr:SpoIID/LytB domain-containing protein [Deltaproteobacteria bacterium]